MTKMKPAEKLPDTVREDLYVDQLVPMEWNANEMDPKEYELLKENITEAGFIDPPAVVPLERDPKITDPREFKYGIIGGEHRWRAAKDLGMEKIPCDIVQGEKWKDEDFRKFQNVRLNAIHGKMNPDKFLKLFNEMADKYGKEKVSKLMGYTSDAPIKKIIKNVARELKSSLPPEMARQFEEQAKEARTVGDLERIIQHLFQEHGDSVKFNFMVFAWGGKEHVYVAMSKRVHQAMKKIMAKSRLGSIDINELLGEAIEKVAESLDDKSNGKAEEPARA